MPHLTSTSGLRCYRRGRSAWPWPPQPGTWRPTCSAHPPALAPARRSAPRSPPSEARPRPASGRTRAWPRRESSGHAPCAAWPPAAASAPATFTARGENVCGNIINERIDADAYPDVSVAGMLEEGRRGSSVPRRGPRPGCPRTILRGVASEDHRRENTLRGSAMRSLRLAAAAIVRARAGSGASRRCDGRPEPAQREHLPGRVGRGRHRASRLRLRVWLTGLPASPRSSSRRSGRRWITTATVCCAS